MGQERMERDRQGYMCAMMAVAGVLGVVSCDPGVGPRSAPGTTGSPLVVVMAEQQLTASTPMEDSSFGLAVGMDGDTAIVGSNDEPAAHIYVREGDSWVHQQRLAGSEEPPDYYYGGDVAVSGDTAVVALVWERPIYVFVREAEVWTLEQTLETGVDGYHESVALDGDTLVACDNAGEFCVVHVRDQGVWTLQDTLQPETPTQEFGTEVDIDGDTIVVYADRADTAVVFVREPGGSTWSQQQVIADVPCLWGSCELAVDGDTLVLGRTDDSTIADRAGSAQVYVRDAGVWTLQQTLYGSDITAGSIFGEGVALEDDRLAVGAPASMNCCPPSDGPGAVYIFTRRDGVWTERGKIVPGDVVEDDEFGNSVAMAGQLLVVGAPEVTAGAPGSGAAYALYWLAGGLEVGTACVAETECDTGFCVDGFCCQSECGGDNPLDCVVCSEELGSSANGACEPVPDATSCQWGSCVAGECHGCGNTYCEDDETCVTCPEDCLPCCGNLELDPGELCDTYEFGERTCLHLGFAAGGDLACTDDCRFDTRGCLGESDNCGNDVIDSGEDCDGDDLGTHTCESQGMGGGLPRCTESCELDLSQCLGACAELAHWDVPVVDAISAQWNRDYSVAGTGVEVTLAYAVDPVNPLPMQCLTGASSVGSGEVCVKAAAQTFCLGLEVEVTGECRATPVCLAPPTAICDDEQTCCGGSVSLGVDVSRGFEVERELALSALGHTLIEGSFTGGIEFTVGGTVEGGSADGPACGCDPGMTRHELALALNGTATGILGFGFTLAGDERSLQVSADACLEAGFEGLACGETVPELSATGGTLGKVNLPAVTIGQYFRIAPHSLDLWRFPDTFEGCN